MSDFGLGQAFQVAKREIFMNHNGVKDPKHVLEWCPSYISCLLWRVGVCELKAFVLLSGEGKLGVGSELLRTSRKVGLSVRKEDGPQVTALRGGVWKRTEACAVSPGSRHIVC